MFKTQKPATQLLWLSWFSALPHCHFSPLAFLSQTETVTASVLVAPGVTRKKRSGDVTGLSQDETKKPVTLVPLPWEGVSLLLGLLLSPLVQLALLPSPAFLVSTHLFSRRSRHWNWWGVLSLVQEPFYARPRVCPEVRHSLCMPSSYFHGLAWGWLFSYSLLWNSRISGTSPRGDFWGRDATDICSPSPLQTNHSTFKHHSFTKSVMTGHLYYLGP